MKTRNAPRTTAEPRPRPRGFTLVELLVVISIIVLITAATLPVVLPALGNRRVSEGARVLHATLSSTRDAAIRAGEPRGIRLIPDPQFPGPNPLAASRLIAIEPAPDYSEGRVILIPWAMGGGPIVILAAEVRRELDLNTGQIINYPPTSWYWNIRQGDRVRFEGSGHEFTIAGPIQTGGVNNPDRFVNADIPGGSPYLSLPVGATTPPGYVAINPLTNAPWGLPATYDFPPPPDVPRLRLFLGEILLLVNGSDDDRDGWVDEGFDGIDNDDDGIIDPGYNGVADSGGAVDGPADFLINNGGEYEAESLPTQLSGGLQTPSRYLIRRRPVVAEKAQEVVLPADVVIDLTSWNAPGAGWQSERSRLPVDPITGVVDILISPTGSLMQPSAGQQALLGADPYSSIPFLHFWLTERSDVGAWNTPGAVPLLLPVPEGTPGYPLGATTLQRQRRLVTLFARTGQVVSNTIENFSANNNPALTPAQNQALNATRPYLEAQGSIRENP